MLYEDKFGVFWIQEEVDKLPAFKVKELELSPSYDEDLFD